MKSGFVVEPISGEVTGVKVIAGCKIDEIPLGWYVIATEISGERMEKLENALYSSGGFYYLQKFSIYYLANVKR